MVESITLTGPNSCTLTTVKPEVPTTGVIVVDWLDFSMISGFTRIEMLKGDVLTVWYYSEHSFIRYAPRRLDAETVQRLKAKDCGF